MDEFIKIQKIYDAEIRKLKQQNQRLRFERHVYKVEMERLRKKLARLYKDEYARVYNDTIRGCEDFEKAKCLAEGFAKNAVAQLKRI